MNNRTEASILADTYESVRLLTKWYLSKMKEVDMHRVFEADGKQLNSAYWIAAHLTWAEQFLLLQALGGKPLDMPWLEQFGIGSKSPGDTSASPPMTQLLGAWKEIHSAAMAHVRSLPDDILGKDNLTGVGFGEDKSYRMIIQHAIRHEAIHAGHLSWLCKLYGIKTI